MNRRTRTDHGYAVITSFLMTLVVLSLSLVAINLAIHNSGASAYDRDRVRAVHAAEAGINDAIARVLSAGAINEAPCSLTAATTASPASSYTATVTYYSTWPLDPNTVIGCVGGALPLDAAPLGAVIDAVGTAGNARRRMETSTRLSPTYGGVLDKAIFSDGTLAISNKVVIEGDVYTNQSWTCPNNIEVQGSFYGQGFADMSNSCQVRDDLWVTGYIRMRNTAAVGANAISSTSTITLENGSSIGNSATAAVSCTGCVLPRVDPARVTIAASAAPPPEPLPEIYFVAADWANAGYEILTFSAATHADPCGAARASVLSFSTASSHRVVRIEETCKLTFSNNTNVVLPHNLAIITDGAIEFVNHGVWTTPDARNRDLFLIVPYDAPARHSSTCGSRLHDITKSNNTDFDHLNFLIYTPCRATFSNNNLSSAGQVYAGEVILDNNFSLTYHSMLIPGTEHTTTIVGFGSQVAYIREIGL